ncbi:DUF1972 domain-containing protein [Puteibacter caeruleilacunae]|nr:DUF1972 domain-containing protein [Puteibacter caeruleilacunae]
MNKSKNINVAIIGTQGIPSQYGGFETLAENLTKFLGNKLEMTVFCSAKSYSFQEQNHNNAKLEYIKLEANGFQSIPYDILSLFKAARKNEQILILGVSGCIILPFFRLMYPKKRLIINIDGLEHRREKWKKPVQKFLKLSERLAIKYGDQIITDNKAIQDYVTCEYKKESELIAYGGDHSKAMKLNRVIADRYNIPKRYAFKVCRIEPENNIHLILEAFKESSLPLVIIGNWDKSEYGRNLKVNYSQYSSIVLLDPIYDQSILDQVRSNCTMYIHGHSAGGTNPSLVEAMYIGLPIIAFDVSYNRETTFNKAKFFKDVLELKELVQNITSEELEKLKVDMKMIAEEQYCWSKITSQYYHMFV